MNLLQVGPKPRFARIPLPPAPNLERRFPQILCDLEERIELYKDRDVEEYPASPSEMTCRTPYGPCTYFDRCQWGK